LYRDSYLWAGMCDWDEQEYAAYLLWVEAARGRAKAAVRPASRDKTPAGEIMAPRMTIETEA